MEIDRPAIGKRLEEFFKSKKIKKKEFASIMNIKPPDVNKYFTGEILPGSEKLLLLAENDCDINLLLTGKPASKREAALIKENEQLKAEIKKHHEYRNAMKVAEQILNYGKDPESK